MLVRKKIKWSVPASVAVPTIGMGHDAAIEARYAKVPKMIFMPSLRSLFLIIIDITNGAFDSIRER